MAVSFFVNLSAFVSLWQLRKIATMAQRLKETQRLKAPP